MNNSLNKYITILFALAIGILAYISFYFQAYK
jgi:hypothetical protein